MESRGSRDGGGGTEAGGWACVGKAPPGGISFSFPFSCLSPSSAHVSAHWGPSPSFNIQSLPPMPSFLWTLGSLPAPSGLEQTALLPSRQGSKEPAEGDGAQPEETPGDDDKASR